MLNPTPNSRLNVSERRVAFYLAGLALILASLPVLYGYVLYGLNFVGTVTNVDDFCNYLAWLYQTSHGHFFVRNLFTTDPQLGHQVYLFYSLLGVITAITHVPEAVILSLSKFVGGAALLYLIYRFYLYCVPNDRNARLTAFGFSCLGSGFGWIVANRWLEKNLPGSPVDAWQPEAFTFLSLETSALFCVSTALIVGTIYALLLGERTGKWRYAVIAGICAAILGNIHSYDIVHIGAAWGLFLVVWSIIKKGEGVGASWGRAILALVMALPTTLYVYYAFRADPVFHSRAEVPTPTPYFWHYIWGYGLIFFLAIACVVFLAIRKKLPPSDQEPESSVGFGPFADFQTALLCICWPIAGFFIVYLPVAFQRKMIMGEHIPLCLLAGIAASIAVRWLPVKARPIVLALLVTISLPSNLLFVRRDLVNLNHNRSETIERPALVNTMLESFAWIRANTAPDAAFVGDPWDCLYIPGQTGRTVWAGHWGETPQFSFRVQQFINFADRDTPDEEKRAFLTETHAQYLWFPNDVSGPLRRDRHGGIHYMADLVHETPSYLTPLYSNQDYTIYRIHL